MNKFFRKMLTPTDTDQRNSDTMNKSSLSDAEKSKIFRNAERDVLRFPYPELESGMTDHIVSHLRGNKFEYVALSQPDTETNKSILRRLSTYKPKSSSQEMPMSSLPKINLIQTTETFPLSSIIGSNIKTKKYLEFILINSVCVSYVPLMSFNDEYSTMKVALFDGRKLRDNEVRTYQGNSNMSFNTELALDYCFPTSSSHHIKLVFSLEQDLVISGEMWGAVQVQIQMVQMDFPEQVSVKEVQGVLRLPESGLKTYKRDPRALNGIIDAGDLEALKTMHKQGDITDISKPTSQGNRRITLAGTSYGGAPVGSDNSSIINDIKPENPIVKWQEQMMNPNITTMPDIPRPATPHTRVHFQDNSVVNSLERLSPF
jgi:hypothetical protein